MTRKRTSGLVATLFLYIIGSNSFNVCATKQNCPDYPEITLGNTNETIKYASNRYNCKCSWEIPSNVQTETSAVLLVLKNVSLPKLSFGCTGSIKFPGGAFECMFEKTYCTLYSKRNTKCVISKKSINDTFKCNKLEEKEWNGKAQKIEYDAANIAGHTKKFTLHYHPIDCTPPTTVARTVKTTATTIGTSPTTEDENPTTAVSVSFIRHHTTHHLLTTSNAAGETQPIFITEPTSSIRTNTQQQDPIISIVVPVVVSLVLLIICACAFLLWKKRTQSKNQQIKVGKHEIAEKETVEKEIYGNNDIEEPETKMNEIYEASPLTTEPVEDACIYAVVNKPKKV